MAPGHCAAAHIGAADVSEGKTGGTIAAFVGSVAERFKAPVLKTGDGLSRP
jgi:hypothetical protein